MKLLVKKSYQAYLFIKYFGIRLFLIEFSIFLLSRSFLKKVWYRYWIDKNEKYDDKKVKNEIDSFVRVPKISIIMPVYNVEDEYLSKAINSVLNQLYNNWELCIYDDGSNKEGTLNMIQNFLNMNDERIKIVFGKENRHISYASNQAISLATGEYMILLDHDDELSPFALYEVVKVLNNFPKTKFIYSNNDLISNNIRLKPNFKPPYSFKYLLTHMYLCHLNVYVTKKVKELNGFREGYEGSQDFDLALRYLENINSNEIIHIPKILYHWRIIPGSTSGGIFEKPYAVGAGERALSDYLKRNGSNATVSYSYLLDRYFIKDNF